MTILIHRYTVSDALADGSLFPIPSQLLKDVGIRFSAVLSRALHFLLEPEADSHAEGQTFEGRLWDLLFLFHIEVKRTDPRENLVVLNLGIRSRGRVESHRVLVHLGPDDEGAPLLTFMLPEDY